MKTRSKNYTEIINQGPPLEPVDKAQPPFAFKIMRLGFQILSPLFPRYAVKTAYRLFTTPMGRARHSQTDAILEKVEVSEFVFGKSLLKLYQWGKAEKTILLVHGWQSRGTALRSFVPGLLKQGYQVVAFDGPAHGDSPGKRLNLPVYGAIINALTNRFENIHAIIGHSFGGGSTLHGLKVHQPVKMLPKLIMIASPLNLSWLVEDYMKQFKLSKRTRELYREMISEKMGLPFEMGDANLFFADLPIGNTLLVHDKGDHSLPFSMSKDFYDRQEKVDMIATEGMGHYKLMKHPEVIEKILEFIKY